MPASGPTHPALLGRRPFGPISWGFVYPQSTTGTHPSHEANLHLQMTIMNNAPERPKPKLVFFQWDHQPNAGSAKFLLLHMNHHVKCLSEYFDLTVINQDCDYIEICERYEPDLTLFESGYRTHGSRGSRSPTRAPTPMSRNSGFTMPMPGATGARDFFRIWSTGESTSSIPSFFTSVYLESASTGGIYVRLPPSFPRNCWYFRVVIT